MSYKPLCMWLLSAWQSCYHKIKQNLQSWLIMQMIPGATWLSELIVIGNEAPAQKMQNKWSKKLPTLREGRALALHHQHMAGCQTLQPAEATFAFLFPGPGFHLPHRTGGHFCPQREMDRLQQQRCAIGISPNHSRHLWASATGPWTPPRLPHHRWGPFLHSFPQLEDVLGKKQPLIVCVECACVQLTQVLSAEPPHFPVLMPRDTVTEIHAGCSPPKTLCLLCPGCWLLTSCLNLCQRA